MGSLEVSVTSLQNCGSYGGKVSYSCHSSEAHRLATVFPLTGFSWGRHCHLLGTLAPLVLAWQERFPEVSQAGCMFWAFCVPVLKPACATVGVTATEWERVTFLAHDRGHIGQDSQCF